MKIVHSGMKIVDASLINTYPTGLGGAPQASHSFGR